MARRRSSPAVSRQGFEWSADAEEALSQSRPAQRRPTIDRDALAAGGHTPTKKLSREEKRVVAVDIGSKSGRPQKRWPFKLGDMVVVVKPPEVSRRSLRKLLAAVAAVASVTLETGAVGLVVDVSEDGQRILIQSDTGLGWARASAVRLLDSDA